MSKKFTTEYFVNRARKVHGNYYDYSKVDYINARINVIIICSTHGEFLQTPSHHLSGQGCPKCSGKFKLTKKEFIKKAIFVHGCKYDYDKVIYINNHTEVIIICPIHGEFLQMPSGHLVGHGCPKCGNMAISLKNGGTLENFIDKAKKVHGNKYDYSKVNYINSYIPVIIICSIDGEFPQTPHNHLAGKGCPKCAGNQKYTTEEFIIKARKIHSDTYDYSKVIYVNGRKEIVIGCSVDGDFHQTPSVHLAGHGCPKCAFRAKALKSTSTTKKFIIKAMEIHGNYYNYSKVDYINSHINVIIICPEHGEFPQTPQSHLSGQGCPKCAGNQKYNTEEFIIRAKRVHGDKYDYSKVIYVNAHTEVIIICPIHGEFLQRPAGHLSGKGCLECSGKKQFTNESFIKRAMQVHSDRYNYSKVIYVNAHTEVIIICPIHGEFLQRPNAHLSQKQGCPHCQSSSGEVEISEILDSKKTEYIKQKSFKGCINPETKRRLKYDFYLPQKNILIEFNGIQHYEYIGYWHGNKNTLASQQYRDFLKQQYALSNGYRYLVIKYTENIAQKLNQFLQPINSQ